MVFARSASNEFISMSTAFRYATDPLNRFQPDIIRQTSNAPYTFFDRWGDYGAINVDPVDGITFWGHHEYAVSNSWRTWVQSFTPDFDVADLNFDGMVGIEDLLILLAAWGPCGPPCPPCVGDLDGDCEVGITDLLILLANWG